MTAQPPGTLIPNPTAQGFNLSPGSQVYKTPTGYVIVSPGKPDIYLSESRNVIRSPTELTNVRTTAVSEAEHKYGHGYRGSDSTYSPETQRAGNLPPSAPHPLVITDVKRAAEAGFIKLPTVEQRPGEIGKVHPGEIIQTSDKRIYGTPDYGVQTTTFTPSAEPLPLRTKSDLNKELGLDVLNQPTSDFKQLDTSRFPAIAVTPARPYIEKEKYATQPVFDLTRDISEKSSKFADDVFGKQSYKEMFTPSGAARESGRVTVKAIGGIPEFFATGLIGGEAIFREVKEGRGKELPSVYGKGVIGIAGGLYEGVKTNPIETIGTVAVSSAMLGGGVRSVKSVKSPVEGITTIKGKPVSFVGTPEKPIMQLFTQKEALANIKAKQFETEFKPNLPLGKSSELPSGGVVLESIKGLKTKSEALEDINAKMFETTFKPKSDIKYIPETPSYGKVPESLKNLVTPKERIQQINTENFIRTFAEDKPLLKYRKESPSPAGQVIPQLRGGLMTKEEAYLNIEKSAPIKNLPEFYNKEVPAGYVPESLFSLRYSPKQKPGLERFIFDERAISYMPTFERQAAEPITKRTVQVMDRPKTALKPLYTLEEVLAKPKTELKPRTDFLVVTKTKTELDLITRTRTEPKTFVFSLVKPETRISEMVKTEPSLKQLLKTEPLTITRTGTKQRGKTSIEELVIPSKALKPAERTKSIEKQLEKVLTKQQTTTRTRQEQPPRELLKLGTPERRRGKSKDKSPAGDFFRTVRKSPIVKGNPFGSGRGRKGKKKGKKEFWEM